VPAFSELLTEFGSNDTAAAVCRINSDADVQLLGLWSLVLGLCSFRFSKNTREAEQRPKTQSPKPKKSGGRRPSLSPASIST
jgi:hypothetical protein